MTEELTLEKKQVMTSNQIKEQDIANCIENCAIESDYWVGKQEIAEYLHTSVDTIQELIQQSLTIVINAEGELTTRKLYKQKTPFFNKLLDTIKNKID
ncbi:MAG: hypothetical protein HRT67_04195 [Flavobacteriaceae bacterium]|nr:hypothetical protein [Flavobacteriaceae bacterium]